MGAHYTPPLLAQFLADRLAQRTRLDGRGPLRILDPACGDGALLEALLGSLKNVGMPQGCLVVGVEADHGAIPQAQSRLDRAGALSCRLIAADFLDLVTRRHSQGLLWESPSPEPDFEGAFDIVIANPPYVRTQILGAEKAQQLAVRYGLSGRVDLYHAFLVAATETLKPGGLMGIITSNRFLSTLGGSSIRGYLASNYEIEEVIDLGDTKLFEAAVLPAILIGRRRSETFGSPTGSRSPFIKVYSVPHPTCDMVQGATPAARVMDALKQGKPGFYETPQGLFKLTTGDFVLGKDPTQVWCLSTPEEATWLNRARAGARGVFGDVAAVRVGIKTTADDVFIRSDWDTLAPEMRPEPDLLRPLLRHEDARPWALPKTAVPVAQILYPHEVSDGRRKAVDLSRYPRTKAYLESNRARLEKRPYVLEAGRAWYEIWVPQDPSRWSMPKIVFPDISHEPRFYLDLQGHLVDGDCYWMTLHPHAPPDMIYLLLAVANSSLATRFHDLAFNNRLYSARRRYITQYVAKYPFPEPASSASRGVIALTKQVCRDIRCQDEWTEHPACTELDRLVYAAFGLDPAEGLP